MALAGMSVKKFIVLGTLFLLSIAGVAVLLLLLHTSSWFIWSTLPDGDLKIVLNQRGASRTIVEQLIEATPLSPALELIQSSARIGISVKGDSITMAIVPKLPIWPTRKRQIVDNLNAQGWDTAVNGLIIIATQGQTQDLISPTSAYTRAIRQIFSRQEAARPILIGHLTALTSKIFDQDVAIRANDSSTGDQSTITIYISPTSDQLVTDRSFPEPSANQLSLIAPTNVFNAMPPDLIQAWQLQFQEKLGFTKTQADLLSAASKEQRLALHLSDQGTSITAQGPHTDQLLDQLTLFIQQEEAYIRPIAKAFQLPDGTIGYERVPGNLEEVISSTKDSDGCYSPLPGRTSLWICHQQNRLSLATGKDLAVEQLGLMTDNTWRLSIGSKHLESIFDDLSIALAALGNDQAATISIFTKTNNTR